MLWVLIRSASAMYIILHVHVDVNHELRKSAKFYIFEKVHQCSTQLLFITSLELFGDVGTYLSLQFLSWTILFSLHKLLFKKESRNSISKI